jgi:hypothetical protein
MHPRYSIVLSCLLAAVLLVAGCSLVEGPDDEGDASEDSSAGTEATASGSAAAEGTLIVQPLTVPAGQAGAFQFTGVPTGTVSTDGTLVVSNLSPGTYTTTEVDPAPDFDLTAVDCDDDDSASTSSGDPQTRTAVFNLDPGETVKCTFTNSRRGSLVVAGQTDPEGAGGTFQFTGVPTGTIPSNGTLVAANLTPGTYTTTEVDPAPDFDLTTVECDDGASATASSGDPQTRTAVFNLDPGEMVTCTFTNTRRGSLVVASQTVPDGTEGTFQFTGVPTGTITSNGTLVASNLTPGTYTTTEVDPAPDFELTAVECDDGGSATASSGDPQSRTAVFNLDPGEMVRCSFTNSIPGAAITPTLTAGGANSGSSTGGEGPSSGSGPGGGGINPFDNPGQILADFPLPDELPPGAGTFAAPKPGPWSVTHFPGQMSCGTFSLDIPSSPPESGTLEVLDGGQTVIGTGLEEAESVSITMSADPEINGRYTGSFEGMEQGVPVTIDYFWQVVTDEHIVGYLTASVTAEGVSCTIYRSFEMVYIG